ncbi:MAG: hypothetical protein GXX79_14445 [Actinomycetales bacterium]|nr:hypothetical protein [Actinomycetales bacterium]
MGVVAFCSAKGSPGVTTSALLVAALWPRRVLLVDADPAGGDVALRLPGTDGLALDTRRGMLTLLPMARRALDPFALYQHAQELSGGVPVLAGLAGPEQAGAVGELWTELARAFAALPGADVIVDAGRVHSHAVHLSLLRQADVVAWVLRPTVAGVVHARERLRLVGPALRRIDGTFPRIGLVVVAPVDARDEVDEVGHAIHAELPFVELFGQVALDERGAGIFEGLSVPRPQRTMLVRSGGELASTLVSIMPEPLDDTRPGAAPPGPVLPEAAAAGPVPPEAVAPGPVPPEAAAPGPVPPGAAPPGPVPRLEATG